MKGYLTHAGTSEFHKYMLLLKGFTLGNLLFTKISTGYSGSHVETGFSGGREISSEDAMPFQNYNTVLLGKLPAIEPSVLVGVLYGLFFLVLALITWAMRT